MKKYFKRTSYICQLKKSWWELLDLWHVHEGKTKIAESHYITDTLTEEEPKKKKKAITESRYITDIVMKEE